MQPWPLSSASQGQTLALAMLGLALAYYVAAILLARRGVRSGIAHPRFSPPEGMSPAAVRSLVNTRCDAKGLAASLVHLAVAGFLRIHRDDAGYTLERLPRHDTPAQYEEHVILRDLFGSGDRVIVRRGEGADWKRLALSLRDTLAGQQKGLWASHGMRKLLGLLLSLTGLTILFHQTSGPLTPGLALAAMLVAGVLFGLGLLRRADRAIRARRVGKALSAGLGMVASLLFLALFGIMLGLQTGLWPGVAVIGLTVVNVLGFRLLRTPTAAGRRLLDEIEGYRMFLSVTEGARLGVLGETITPTVYETHLPYAMALDLEQDWGRQFRHALARTGEDRDWSPSWYVGDSSGWSDDGLDVSFADAFSDSFSDAVSDAGGDAGGEGGGDGDSDGGGDGGGGDGGGDGGGGD